MMLKLYTRLGLFILCLFMAGCSSFQFDEPSRTAGIPDNKIMLNVPISMNDGPSIYNTPTLSFAEKKTSGPALA